jgi:hypothetical protein
MYINTHTRTLSLSLSLSLFLSFSLSLSLFLSLSLSQDCNKRDMGVISDDLVSSGLSEVNMLTVELPGLIEQLYICPDTALILVYVSSYY